MRSIDRSMRTFALGLALLFAISVGCSTSKPHVRVLDRDDPLALAFLQSHNGARTAIRPAPSPRLRPLRWSTELAEYAAKTAQRCEFDHRPGPYGENLAAQLTDGGPASGSCLAHASVV